MPFIVKQDIEDRALKIPKELEMALVSNKAFKLIL